jgi:hypothetical protein
MEATKIVKREKVFVLKPYNKKELSLEYEISIFILNKWLKAIEIKLGKPIGRLYNIQQVQLIISTYGVPGQVINEAA